jgi:hypothetical protein
VGLDDAVQLLVLVPTGHEYPAVDEMSQPAAEDIEAGVDVDRRLGAGDRIPDGRSCVVLHGIRLGRVVADRVVRENLAVRKQCNVHSDDRPIDDRTPLADILSTPGDHGSGSSRVLGADRARVRIERSFLLSG